VTAELTSRYPPPSTPNACNQADSNSVQTTALFAHKFWKLAKYGSLWNYFMMQALTEQLIESGLRDKVLSERQLERVAGGSAARRYGLVNRALKANELIRVRRGLYVLPPKYRTEAPHPFALAQALQPGSYVSFETALSSHGWIPERVHVVASVVPGRKSAHLEHPSLGTFTFHPLALHSDHYLELVERQPLGSQVALVAQPLRALLDLVTLRKLEWQGLQWLTEGFRIEAAPLHSLTRDQIQTMADVYKQKRPNDFLKALTNELHLD
jgi:hypothetical protein